MMSISATAHNHSFDRSRRQRLCHRASLVSRSFFGSGDGPVNSTVMRIPIPNPHTVLVATILVVFVASADAQRADLGRWQTINAEGLFTFRLPVGFKQSEMGIDTYMRGYQRGRARFIFVCGDSASDEYDEQTMRYVREVPTNVGGKTATVRTFVYKWKRAPVYVTELNVGNWRGGRVELYMGMESPNRADIQTAKQIFRSVKFLKAGCA
jgi:hypothetical protein